MDTLLSPFLLPLHFPILHVSRLCRILFSQPRQIGNSKKIEEKRDTNKKESKNVDL